MQKQARTFHGVAVDAGSGLEKMLRDARGAKATQDDLSIFKRSVMQELGVGASTVLVDSQLGPDLLPDFPVGCEPTLAYEADVYHISDDDRITVLPEHLKPEDFASLGVKQLKFFIYYAPDDAPLLNKKKQALVANIGEQCAQLGLQYLMEPLVYHPTIKPGTAEYAKIKPDMVTHVTELFAQPQFHADILKVEIPVDLNFVEGFGEPQRTRDEALDAFRQAAEPAKQLGLVYLSAGVSFEWFEASLQMADEAGVKFSGFMCGRALWADAISEFGSGGEDALRLWLQQTGIPRLQRLISALG